MFAATVEASKLERALDLVDRLNLEKSYELAMTIADRHRKLVDLIEDRKYAKFGGLALDEEEEDFDAESPQFTEHIGGGRPRISPDSGTMGKRPIDDTADSRHVRQRQTIEH